MDSSEPIVISAILLSDHAIREAGTNKLTLIGIFSVWNAPGFPFRAPAFVITPFISNLRSASGERNLAVRIENVQSRHVVFSAGGKFTLGGHVTTNAVGDGSIPVPPGMVLPEAGRYRIYILIDGEEIGTRDFEAQQAPHPLPGPQG
jgi:hypothetical protein